MQPERASLGDVRVLWLGLGQLGRALACRLTAAGVEVQGVDPRARDGLPFGVCERLDGVPARYPVMVACLPTVTDLLESVEYALSLADDRRPGVIINLSTIGPAAAMKAARMAQDTGGTAYVEAPVSGGVLRAREGNIAIFWGSDDGDHLGLAQAVLEILARTVIRVDSIAAASSVKLINNFLAITNAFAVIEGLRLGLALGLLPETTRELLENGTSDSYVLRSTVKRPLISGDMTTGFVTRLALKDMLLLRDAIGDVNSEAIDSVIAQLADAVERGYGEKVFPMAMLDRHLGARQVASGATQQSPSADEQTR
jgi:3-hydroxyisobutyrate dehydrogenase